MFLQFGTSRFLQAHADLIISEALPPRQITVVQSSGNSDRAHRLAHLADPSGYPVRIQGQSEGVLVDTEKTVTSVRKAISSATEWDSVVEEAKNCRFILSNVSEAGYASQPADAMPDFDNAMSFVAKLTLLLKERHAAGVGPCTILPLELFPDNGTNLKNLVLAQAERWDEPAAFRDAINAHIWVNSLVDRIVSEPISPVGAIAEPYCLWAIQSVPGMDLPFAHHPAVELTDDLKVFERLKLFLLNLCHTYMAENWRRDAMDADMLVKEYVGDPTLLADLKTMIREEVLPVFAAAGLGSQAETYFEATLERFQNPFLKHRISDIANGHAGKVSSRIGSFLSWAQTVDTSLKTPKLMAIDQAYSE